MLSTTVIQDSSVYSSSELFELYRDHLGQRVTKETSRTIAETVRARYRADGYSRPGFRILDHGVQSGIVRIRLLEPSISGVALNGNAGPYREQVDSLFAGLPSGGSLRPEAIRDAMRRANSMPGLEVNVSTIPDEQKSGGFVLEVDSDYQSFEGMTTISNRGTREIGRNLAFARLIHNGTFGGQNSAGVYAATAKNSRDYRSGGAFLTVSPGANGLKISLQGSATSLQIVSSGILVDQNRNRFRLKVGTPFEFRRTLRTNAWAAFEMDDLDMMQGGVRRRTDKLRSISSGLSASWRGEGRQQLLSLELEKGLGVLDAGLEDLFDPGDPREHDYTITQLHYINLSELTDAWSFRVDAYGQYSAEFLPSVKQFKVGGGRIGRGFEAAALRGDRGVGAKLQLGRDVGGRSWILERGEVYGFFDHGSAWRHDVAGRESAASAGLGYSMRSDHFAGRLELAKPLTHDDADGRRDASLFFEISASF